MEMDYYILTLDRGLMVTVRSIESHRNYDNNNKKAKMIKYQEHLHLIEMQTVVLYKLGIYIMRVFLADLRPSEGME